MPLAIPLIVLVAVLFSLGAAATSRSLSGGIGEWLPGWVKKAAFFAIPIAEQTVALAKFISNKLGVHYGAIVHHAVRWFSQLAHYVDVVGYWSLYWPVALYHVTARIIYHEIPTAVRAHIHYPTRQLRYLTARVKALAHEVAGLPHRIKGIAHTVELTRIFRVAMPHAAEWKWIHDHFGALKKAVAAVAAAGAGLELPHFPAFPLPWRALDKRIRALRKDLTFLLGATGAALLVARALGITSKCVRSGNVGKLARSICGIPSDLIALLLGGLVVLEGGFSVVEFAKGMQAVEDELIKGLTATITELQGL